MIQFSSNTVNQFFESIIASLGTFLYALQLFINNAIQSFRIIVKQGSLYQVFSCVSRKFPGHFRFLCTVTHLKHSEASHSLNEIVVDVLVMGYIISFLLSFIDIIIPGQVYRIF